LAGLPVKLVQLLLFRVQKALDHSPLGGIGLLVQEGLEAVNVALRDIAVHVRSSRSKVGPGCGYVNLRSKSICL